MKEGGAVILILAVVGIFGVIIFAGLQAGYISNRALLLDGSNSMQADLDMDHNYMLNMDMDEHLHHDAVAGIGYQVIDQISAGYLTQDRHIHSMHVFVSPAPGGGKSINIAISDGTSNIWVNITGADQEGFSDTGSFDWDVSAETFTAGYMQTAGGAVDEFCIHYDWHYKENE